MKTFEIYTARLEYGQYNQLIGEIKAYSVEQVKDKIKKPVLEGGMNLNPYYAVIVDVTDGSKIVVHNKFCQFVTKK